MLRNLLKKFRLLPGVTIPDTDSALAIAEAVREGGLSVMEVTFRTDSAASAIAAIAGEFPEMHIGAGTILSMDQLFAARDAGAQFGLAPGFNKRVIEKAKEYDFPFIPGVMTPSEIELALNYGYNTLKLFPVSDLGGVEYIQSLEGPYHHTGVKFLAMGGVNPSNLQAYLENDMVIAAGGSWLGPSDLIRQKKYKQITEIIRESLAIVDQS